MSADSSKKGTRSATPLAGNMTVTKPNQRRPFSVCLNKCKEI